MIGSLRPFWAETTQPVGARYGRSAAAAPAVSCALTQRNTVSKAPATLSGRTARASDMARSDRPGDLQAALVQSRDMGRVAIHEQHIPAGPDEGRPQAAADGAGAPDENCLIPHAQGPSSRARVSATATCQMASMSSSGRS